ncbi:restriction endonuclease subunit S, partial [Dysgonomonas sp. 520]|uniref:restriction endonuclease subunit S n=1 Tax=Dysgonomonas sp. 520 TaxID=2302931 RepID=UPI0013D1B5A4
EWEKKKLGEIAKIIGGGTPDTIIDEYWNGDIQWFTPSEIKSNYVAKSDRKITKLGLSKSSARLLPIGTILLTTRATIGEVAIATEECTTNQGFQSLIVNENINNIFISNWIKQNKKELIKRANGSTFSEISKSEIESIPILLPDTLEQDKIASFLSLLDERIETQNKIIEKLESLIRGIYSVAKRESWIMLYLRDVLEERKEQNSHGYPIFSVAVREGIINQIEHLGRSFAAKDTRNYNVVQLGDIVYTKSPTGDFPYGIVKQSFIDQPVAVSPLYGVYKPKNYHLGNILHHYFLSPINANNYLYSLIQKGAKNTINITTQRFLDKAILLPTQEIEIKNISLLLEVINKKIHLEKDALIKLESQKKILLQRMFI